MRKREGRFPELALLHAIPNGGLRAKATAVRLKAEGVRSGVPDMCLPVARGGYHGLYIELKAIGGDKASPNQNLWIEALGEQGYRVELCWGSTAAIRVLMEYLGIPPEEQDQLFD